MSMFKNSAEIRNCASDLIASLADLKDAQGSTWTDENFRRFAEFSKLKNPALKYFYRKSEFLWAFA